MEDEGRWGRVRREEGFRASAAYAKKFMGLQIDLFEAWYVLSPSFPFRIPHDI